MAKANPKIVLSRSQDIPFNKLVLSQANVRRVKAGISIEELAEDIARRGLLQGLSVRPVLDADGNETGMFEVPAGGRRYPRARAAGQAEAHGEDRSRCRASCATTASPRRTSLAENVQRVAAASARPVPRLPDPARAGPRRGGDRGPLLRQPGVVKQRLKLAAVSPKLLDLYAEDEMTLEQLMAFTVTDDHARQEQVWEALVPLLQQGALLHPPPADRGRRPRRRQAGAVRRHRRL